VIDNQLFFNWLSRDKEAIQNDW